MLGYYVPYDETSWRSFEANAEHIDYLSAQWVEIDDCGNLLSLDDRTLVAFARERGVAVLPELLTYDSDLNHLILTDPPTRARILDQIVRYVVDEGYPGFDLDLENIEPDDRDALSSFVADLAAALHREGKILAVAAPAKVADVRDGWAGPFDYAEIGRHADLVVTMAYEFHWSGGEPGSLAPQWWVEQAVDFAASQIPKEKLLLGIAFYGYDWHATDYESGRARALTYPQAIALAERYGVTPRRDAPSRSTTFSYTSRPGEELPALPVTPNLGHEIVVRRAGACEDWSAGTVPAPTPFALAPEVPVVFEAQPREVWIEDAASVAGRIEIVRDRGIAGIAGWRIGQEDPAIWPAIRDFRDQNHR